MIYNLYKPSSISSNHYLQWFKKKYSINKAGYTGTLDPLAEGVLPIFTESDTKLINYYDDSLKTYQFTMRLGFSSISYDSENKVVITNQNKEQIIKTKIESGLNKFSNYNQIPPIYSAIEKKGVASYKLAREGKITEEQLKPREAKILKWKVISISKQKIEIKITCNKGFYVRSLVRDLANYLEIDAITINIKRIKCGKNFILKNSLDLNNLLNIEDKSLLPTIKWWEIFKNVPKISITNNLLIKSICNGQKISLEVKDINYKRDLSINEIKIRPKICFISDINNNLISIVNISIEQASKSTFNNRTKNNNFILTPIRCI